MNISGWQSRWLRLLVAVFSVWLIAATWPLWWNAPAVDCPRIPWFAWLLNVPFWLDRVALVGTLAGAVLMGASSVGRASCNERLRLTGTSLFVAGWLVLVALDQHRLQPWACQFILFGTLTLLLPQGDCTGYWRWIVASIYIWSAISKCDAAFLTAQGQLLLQGLLDPLGIDQTFWPLRIRVWLAGTFPIGEMLVGVLLLTPRTRRWGLFGSIAMHLALLWTLGYSLGHEWGVLIWNLFFIAQNIVVFGWNGDTPAETQTRQGVISEAARQKPRPHGKAFLPVAFTCFAVAYPGFETIGWCDHWPAWAVYSSRPAQVRILIDEDSARKLPVELKRFLGRPQPLDDRVPFSLEAWSFATTQSPVYPQLRYRLAAALALLGRHVPDDALTIEVQSTPDRWTGKRQPETLSGQAQIEAACQRSFFNTRAR
ncbi:MauE/DoxX family redox-associated membrane protein [Planctomicrobium piriforme]|uniref:Methylamine utilisation protein MauE domain-containing protein n=1 Tax=Planctomicrobium piriforme TaxID=1576369 RepID=A0A1I3ILG3_9PLAN|nr:MauE/DoxX family redox-associated membrane protein [Planctomicrobium piriforme]SFI48828.1 hypothetical protein SAMN05421753_109176 [Planctomicrobium piriforme]